MHKKVLILFILLFALIVYGMFQFAFLFSPDTEVQQPEPTPAVTQEAPPILHDSSGDSEEDENIDSQIDANAPAIDPEAFVFDRQFINGEHIIQGVVSAPSPCHEITEEVVIMESFPEQVRITWDLVAPDLACIQVVTPISVETRVNVSPDATFTATYNGTKVDLSGTTELQ